MIKNNTAGEGSEIPWNSTERYGGDGALTYKEAAAYMNAFIASMRALVGPGMKGPKEVMDVLFQQMNDAIIFVDTKYKDHPDKDNIIRVMAAAALSAASKSCLDASAKETVSIEMAALSAMDKVVLKDKNAIANNQVIFFVRPDMDSADIEVAYKLIPLKAPDSPQSPANN